MTGFYVMREAGVWVKRVGVVGYEKKIKEIWVVLK